FEGSFDPAARILARRAADRRGCDDDFQVGDAYEVTHVESTLVRADERPVDERSIPAAHVPDEETVLPTIETPMLARTPRIADDHRDPRGPADRCDLAGGKLDGPHLPSVAHDDVVPVRRTRLGRLCARVELRRDL